MTAPTFKTWADWIKRGSVAPHILTLKSAGTKLDMVEAIRPRGDLSRMALPSMVLNQDLVGGTQLCGDFGSGRFAGTSVKGGFYLAPPNADYMLTVDADHHTRALAFSIEYWQMVVDWAADRIFSLTDSKLYNGQCFRSPLIHSIFRQLWRIGDDGGAPSRMLAQAAGCEILAELCRLHGAPFSPANGGLAPWAERRCIEIMRMRLAEDISLVELAVEAKLSPFHFSRMFKQSVGVPPRVFLTQLRVDKACELLRYSDLPITEIAFEVGYSSSQVLARVFLKHRNTTPTDYRREYRKLQ
ncbi:AraC family transcriptional regulator [Neorhizobium huautlense]|uniref:AraC family transcriptional regulator n=1 Tax=Neorhizobium huautlense TaxID=67774 RepID=A0ABT9Q3B8_9HYPH|nr:AraC family transcriptional regulator [Neorhizobium huautlense]MDP9840574.1 AraC family transcriptional regulator [Neorhizobium huautlense]